jgi:hypothetical protein
MILILFTGPKRAWGFAPAGMAGTGVAVRNLERRSRAGAGQPTLVSMQDMLRLLP